MTLRHSPGNGRPEDVKTAMLFVFHVYNTNIVQWTDFFLLFLFFFFCGFTIQEG